MLDLINAANDFLWTYVMIALLTGAAVWFTIETRGVQFRLIGEMWRLLGRSGKRHEHLPEGSSRSHYHISSFQAFAVSVASRVGTGNLAGVATAIALGGPGSIFWMWAIAILGSANAFIESTLAQLFKVKGAHSFRGGPAYYISKGIGSRLWAITFAILITVTFALAFQSVQSNTIALAFEPYGVAPAFTGALLSLLTLACIWGGIRSIAKVSQVVVPVMAILYILLALVIVAMNIHHFPDVIKMIVSNAFGLEQVMGGGVGMAVIMGVKRGLFSNEAGEGSTPNAAATASVSHPVKQGLLQTLGVYVDTLFVCTATAFIILCSGVFDSGETGIALTQAALDNETGSSLGSAFVAAAIFFFAFSSIIANYYYGEANIQFITTRRWPVTALKLCSTAMVMTGALVELDTVWALADITMALMTICNVAAILVLGRYAVACLADYTSQRRQGLDPLYRRSAIPSIARLTECWPL
ncbi:MAG: alanine:cation symporter family protein [Pseudoflavonifractor sp.]|nr:alanine:cation symporter family protein [Alloprevotella sp.]MCM1117150.1 alanine:cation symporter family protein [Pseudoflavonifractor sp.]